MYIPSFRKTNFQLKTKRVFVLFSDDIKKNFGILDINRQKIWKRSVWIKPLFVTITHIIVNLAIFDKGYLFAEGRH